MRNSLNINNKNNLKSIYVLIIKNELKLNIVGYFSSQIKCNNELENWVDLNCDFPCEISIEVQYNNLNQQTIIGWAKLVEVGNILDVEREEKIYTIEVYKILVL